MKDAKFSGIVVNPFKAFRVCHGIKVDDELILWSPGVIGVLSDEQEKLCKKIIIENAEDRKVFSSVEEALKADVKPTKKLRQVVAIRTCAQLLDKAEDYDLIQNIKDVWAFMDYCMAKQGFGKVERKVPERIKEFIDESFEKLELKKAIEKIERINEELTLI